MAPVIENLDDLANKLVERARTAHLKVDGPVSTDLGYGGPPIVTFWSGERRLHFSFGSHAGAVSVFVEAVDRGAAGGARVGSLSTEDEAWKIMEGFLGRGKSLHRLPEIGWTGEEPVNDALIPHPPTPPPKQATPAAPARAPAPKAAATPAGIGGVVLFSNDAAKLSRWYADHLGIAFTDESGNFHGDAGGISFGIYASGDLLVPGVRAMMTFTVPDFDAFVENLATQGVNVEGLDRTSRGRFAYVRDTDGNPVELWDGGS